MSLGERIDYTHQDQDPWKGWFNLTVKNDGTAAWGDFHFLLFEAPNYPGSVFFKTDPHPTSSQSGLSWNLSASGKELDLFFYGDPVLPGETATFSVYTDNTSNPVSYTHLTLPTIYSV